MFGTRASLFELSHEHVQQHLHECGIPFWPHGLQAVRSVTCTCTCDLYLYSIARRPPRTVDQSQGIKPSSYSREPPSWLNWASVRRDFAARPNPDKPGETWGQDGTFTYLLRSPGTSRLAPCSATSVATTPFPQPSTKRIPILVTNNLYREFRKEQAGPMREGSPQPFCPTDPRAALSPYSRIFCQQVIYFQYFTLV